MKFKEVLFAFTRYNFFEHRVIEAGSTLLDEYTFWSKWERLAATLCVPLCLFLIPWAYEESVKRGLTTPTP